MCARILISFLCLFCLGLTTASADDNPTVEVAAPYLDLRTGPGRGYPQTQSILRGDIIEILVRRTSWVKIRTEKGLEGWLHETDLLQTINPNGNPVQLNVGGGRYDFRNWEAGFKLGSYEGARFTSLFAGYYLTDNLTLEGTVSQAFGRSADLVYFNAAITHQFWPDWRFSPFFTIGGGIVETHYSKTEVQLSDRTDQTLHAGLGLRIYLYEHLMLRTEYRSNIILTDRDDNEESDEWTIGLSAFF